MKRSVLTVAVLGCMTALLTTASLPASAATSAPKRGVVTIQMATVGDPGNPSVGVVQSFKIVGTPGPSVTLTAGTGIYANCRGAPASTEHSYLTCVAGEYTHSVGDVE